VYYALDVEIPEAEAEPLQGALDETGTLGLEVRDASLKLPPGAPVLPAGRVQLRAWYGAEAEVEAAAQRVREQFPEALARTEAVEPEDWAETWKRHVRPVRAGRLWVGPPWELANRGDAAAAVVIEPGMAFGTGDHPTTALCLAALDEALARRGAASVLDVGTGSGVLAIAARKLGASRVVGNDIDPGAVRIARENAEKNGAEGIEFSERPLERIAGGFDVVVANLFSGVICQLAPRLAARLSPGGELLVSGILEPQVEEVLAALTRERLRLRERRIRGEWALLALEPRP
jgi:ribosomal protein L11 methyltransferase